MRLSKILIRDALLVVLMAVVSTAVVAACTEKSTPTPTTTTVALTAEDILSAASETIANMSTAKFKMVDETGTGQKFYGMTFISMEATVEDPDSLDVSIEGESSVGFIGFVKIGMVRVGDQAFIRLSEDAPWSPMPPDNIPFDFAGLKLVFTDLPTTIQGLTMGDHEEVQGSSTVVVSGTIQSDDLIPLVPTVDLGHTVKLTLWIDETELLLRQLRIIGKMFADDAPETSRLIDVKDINVPVEIELPDTTSNS